MFTGIVEGTGRIKEIRRSGKASYVVIDGKKTTPKLQVSDSVAINGVCLTVVARRKAVFEVQAVEETLRKTNLGALTVGDEVNLELPLRVSDRLGGHIVQGHIDGVGRVVSIKPLKKSWMFRVRAPQKFLKYLVPTGSIAVDGVSLTVARLNGPLLDIAIIPHTMKVTNFKHRKRGDPVNLEFDVLGKYVESLLGGVSGRRRK